MLYAILAHHVENVVASWTPEQDAAVMRDLEQVHQQLMRDGIIGPAARLGATEAALVLSGPGAGVVTDGPFSETKEQMLGFYIIDCAGREAAISVARDLRRANPTATYEIRPIRLYRPGTPFPLTEAAAGEA